MRDWIAQGAVGPTDETLHAPVSKPASPAQNAEAQNVQQIRERILAHQQEKAEAYKVTIPNTTVSYAMAPVAAGDFLMGSSAKPDEQPPHKVHVDAFWMQAHEVTWDEHRLFMFANQAG